MRTRLAGFCGPGFAVELGVGVAMGVELKIVFAGTGKDSEGRGGCKQAMWSACRTEKMVSQILRNRVSILPENLPTICHVALLIHSAIACCTAIDTHRILKAGMVTIGHIFPRHTGTKVVTNRILKRGA